MLAQTSQIAPLPLHGTDGAAGGPLQPLLERFTPADLASLDRVALLDRRDTKYLLVEDQLHAALGEMDEHYRVLEVGGVRVQRYETLYFDTPDFELYRAHHSGRPVRTKVRSRFYCQSGAAFVETKTRLGSGRTVKARLPTNGFVRRLDADACDWLEQQMRRPVRLLVPQLCTSFWRLTLVSRHRMERLTFDLGLEVSMAGRQRSFPGLVIGEVKEARGVRDSEFARFARPAGIRPVSVSKYCVGIATLVESVKRNNFKPVLRTIDRIKQETN